MTLDDLHPTDRAKAIAGFVDDVMTVCAHVVRNVADYPNTHTMAALIASLERREVPPPQPTLATAVAWVLFTMQWNRKYRPLTEAEIRIHDAAWRLSDAIHGPRHQ